MNRATLAAAVLASLPSLAPAQPLPPGAERAQDRVELRQDRRELADDRRDVFFSEALLARFDAARAQRGRRALAAVEGEVLRELDRELKEARREAARSGAEVRRDGRELREERREVRADVAHGDRREAWDDRRDLRDDRRDLRDDRRDVRDDRRDLARVKALRTQFASLRGRTDRRSLDRKRGVVAELVAMARAELHEDRGELREDRRELREDRREDRDDRRR